MWELKFKGRDNTPLAGGYYECEFDFKTPNYPLEPPELKFKNNFEHMHVFVGGNSTIFNFFLSQAVFA